MNEYEDSPEEIEVEALEVFVEQQPIELYKVLKIGNLVNGGGEAKMAIAEGYVGVNGELEQQKRKKIYAGDIIEFNGQFLYVVCDQAVTEKKMPAVIPQDKTSKVASSKTNNKVTKQAKSKKPSTKARQQHADTSKKNQKTGRHSIKF
ncbi:MULTISPECIES: RNA-binding S4 domain-containing protein [unclassified Agarivorans]|uniref:RNA-binding S4 domain-containing protein n=1 Tax=unclassified Agarivorans TaxID=2636026 RepID=UPI0026E3DA52|nr:MULTISPECIES: RNA-binding S4 domain-containing protein [unclassified Agarivorans]MDO6686307.1 RNA-binding S4 domain-containing protein [Agarivorans sp. 3_MG-2023]MDO6713609.1 RNA-binding S4 domain-containing protein [Agarivorans sp. 2_MG-2023]